MTPAEKDAFDKFDMQQLLTLPSFNRFLFRLVLASGLMRSGGDDGRRSLGEDVLRWAEDALGGEHLSGLPVLASIQLLSAVRDDSVTKENSRRGKARIDRGDILPEGDDGDGAV
jgi:hypothetical protein